MMFSKLLKHGNNLYHKKYGHIKVTRITNYGIEVILGDKQSFSFFYYLFGRDLFLNEKDSRLRFYNAEQYLDHCIINYSQYGHKDVQSSIQDHQNKITYNLYSDDHGDYIVVRDKIQYVTDELIDSIKQKHYPSEIEFVRKDDAKNLLRKDKERLLHVLQDKYLFEGFHHYTDLSNFLTIMITGKLLCRLQAGKYNFKDAADQAVLGNTDTRIKNYVRFFYKERTPTLHNNEGMKSDNASPHMPNPVLLLFDEEIIYHSHVAFLSGGGGNHWTKHTKDAIEALKFDWKKIFSRWPIKFESNKHDITHKRNAEFLYPEGISIEHVKKVIFRSRADYRVAVSLLGENQLFEIDYAREKFHYIHNFLNDYSVNKKDSLFTFRLVFESSYLGYTHEFRVKYSDNEEEIHQADANNLENNFKLNHLIEIEFDIETNKYKRVKSIEYLMNKHVCAIWKDG